MYKRYKKEVFIYKESIVYPLVEMIPKYNTKDGLFYLSNNQYVEILNYVQYTLMSALFWTSDWGSLFYMFQI